MFNACRRWVESQHEVPTAWGKAILGPMAMAYAFVVGVRNALYDWKLLPMVTMPVPVISVGNITTGGTGKTPIVKELSQYLVGCGLKVVVLTRGYKAKEPLDYGRPKGPQHGDEAFWLQQQVPDAVVIVGKNRVANALKACSEYHPDVILLEDGFQHRRLARTVDVVLVDSSTDASHTAVLPLGTYREPIAFLKRADAVWLTKGSEATRSFWKRSILDKISNHQAVEEIPFDSMELLDDKQLPIQNLPKQAVLISGLAKPVGFENSVKALGVGVAKHQSFPDHVHYTPSLVARLVMQTPKEIPFVTTEKDWVKLSFLVGQSKDQWTVLRVLPSIPKSAFQWVLSKAGLSERLLK